MSWSVKYVQEALNDLQKLDRSDQLLVLAAIEKLKHAPLPRPDGYGDPLGSRKSSGNLTGLLKLYVKDQKIRIVYKIESKELKIVHIIVIDEKEKNKVYEVAAERYQQYKEVYLSKEDHQKKQKRGSKKSRS